MSNDFSNIQLGRYHILSEIGRGGFSIVYRAEMAPLNKPVALKLLLPTLFSDAEAIQRFTREAQTVAGLNHPRIVRVLDLDSLAGRLFMALEYMGGGNLAEWAQAHRPPPFRQSAQIVADIAAALDYAHSQGVIHGDVKPANVLLGEGETPVAKLADFGILRAVEQSGVTSGDQTIGTPFYISPEQAEGKRPTPAADQYSLGVLAYELFCGKTPFGGETPLAIYLKHIREAPPPPNSLNPLITAALQNALLRALAKNPAERYPTCSEFAKALLAAVAGMEADQFRTLIARAQAALAAHDAAAARQPLGDALRMLPADAQAKALWERLEKQERAQSGYAEAAAGLENARQAAHQLQEKGMSDPEGLLAALAPPAPPLWKRLQARWKAALWLALVLCLAGLVSALAWVGYSKTAAGKPQKETLVAFVRTSTFTPTPTPTFTPTQTPTHTATHTPTRTEVVNCF